MKKISLVDFKKDVDRILIAAIKKGHDSMEPCDIGDLIGRLITSDSLREMQSISDSFCRGFEHGAGVSHQVCNNRNSIEETITQYEK